MVAHWIDFAKQWLQPSTARGDGVQRVGRRRRPVDAKSCVLEHEFHRIPRQMTLPVGLPPSSTACASESLSSAAPNKSCTCSVNSDSTQYMAKQFVQVFQMSNDGEGFSDGKTGLLALQGEAEGVGEEEDEGAQDGKDDQGVAHHVAGFELVKTQDRQHPKRLDQVGQRLAQIVGGDHPARVNMQPFGCRKT